MTEALLELRNLTTIFPTRRGPVRAVDGVSFTLQKEEKLGIVGESGSGKSVTLLSIMGLAPYPGDIVQGDIVWRGESLLQKTRAEMRKIRGKEIAMIFQDPLSTLNPVFNVGSQIRESLRIHHIIAAQGSWLARLTGRQRRAAELERVIQAMREVGISSPQVRARHYPHQLSGGMQQRAIIAIALSCEPSLILADEPTTALDVTIQAQIMDLLDRINQERGASIILVTHNLGLVAEFCENVVVMYAGWMMEKGVTDEVVSDPRHPYTQGLLRCLPRMTDRGQKILPIPGLVPDLVHLPPGCPFAPRCDQVMPACREERPIPLTKLDDGRLVRCLLYER
jgi:peptide/nickel transport system ATP-binding protein/oligopeptide transport system ATP-binding protein